MARLFLLLYCVGFLVARFGYRYVAFPVSVIPPAVAPPDEFAFPSADGVSLRGRWFPLAGAQGGTPTILRCGGNAESVRYADELALEWNDRGFNVFLFDYRGYGGSEGAPSESGLYSDVEGAWTHLTSTLGIAPRDIVLLGRSIGGGPATHLAAQKTPQALVLESAFTSLYRVPVPFPLYPFDRFQNLRKIPKVTCPVLVIHGEADTLIPPRHGERLFAAATSRKAYLPIPRAGHNDLDSWLTAEHKASILKFLRQGERSMPSNHPLTSN